MNRNSSFYSGYEFIKNLASSRNSHIMLVKRYSDAHLFALKQIRLDKLSHAEKMAIFEEIRIMASITSPYIIRYETSFYSVQNNCLCILMEYAEEGDLSEHIDRFVKNQSSKGLPQQFIWSTIIRLLKALKLMHSNHIAHRDVKTANVYLSSGKAKLGDFGVSKVAPGQIYQTKISTPYFTPPQIWKGQKYTSNCDIWSLGCLIYEMCALEPPFTSKNLPNLFVQIAKGQFSPLPSYYSEQLRALVRMCLSIDPLQRPSVNELLMNEALARKKEWTDNWEELGQVNLLKSYRFPKINLFINDMLKKMNEDFLKNRQSLEPLSFKTEKRKNVLFLDQQSGNKNKHQEKKQISIRIRKSNGSKKESQRTIKDDQVPLSQDIQQKIKKRDFRSAKHIKQGNGMNFRVKSCKKIHDLNKQNRNY